MGFPTVALLVGLTSFQREKHEADHRPMIHNGPVIKTNANQRYSTTAVTGTLIRELAKKHDIPVQVSCHHLSATLMKVTGVCC